MDTKQMCMSDSDCSDNYLCSFDNNDLNHYCVKNEESKLYQGCLVDMNNYNIKGIASCYNNDSILLYLNL